MKISFNGWIGVGLLGLIALNSYSSLEDRIREDFLKGKTLQREYCTELVQSYPVSEEFVGKALNAVAQQVKHLASVVAVLNKIPDQEEWTSKIILDVKGLLSRHNKGSLEDCCTLGDCSKQVGFIRRYVEEMVPCFVPDTSKQFLEVFHSLPQYPEGKEEEHIKDMRDVYTFLFHYMPEEGVGRSETLLELHQKQINWYQRFLTQLKKNCDPVDEQPHPDNFESLLMLFNKRLGVALGSENFYFNTTNSFPIWRSIRDEGISALLNRSDDALKELKTSKEQMKQLQQSEKHVLEPRLVELIIQVTSPRKKEDFQKAFKKDVMEQEKELERRINVLNRSMQHMEKGKSVNEVNQKKIRQIRTHLSYLEETHKKWQVRVAPIPALIEDVKKLSQQRRDQKAAEEKKILETARGKMQAMNKTSDIIDWFQKGTWFNALAVTQEERQLLNLAHDRLQDKAKARGGEVYAQRMQLLNELLKGVKSYQEAYDRFVAFGKQ